MGKRQQECYRTSSSTGQLSLLPLSTLLQITTVIVVIAITLPTCNSTPLFKTLGNIASSSANLLSSNLKLAPAPSKSRKNEKAKVPPKGEVSDSVTKDQKSPITKDQPSTQPNSSKQKPETNAPAQKQSSDSAQKGSEKEESSSPAEPSQGEASSAPEAPPEEGQEQQEEEATTEAPKKKVDYAEMVKQAFEKENAKYELSPDNMQQHAQPTEQINKEIDMIQQNNSKSYMSPYDPDMDRSTSIMKQMERGDISAFMEIPTFEEKRFSVDDEAAEARMNAEQGGSTTIKVGTGEEEVTKIPATEKTGEDLTTAKP